MSIQPVRLGKRSNSMGVIVDSHLPHLIGMDDDILSTGVMMYHLKEGKTYVGTEESERDLEICTFALGTSVVLLIKEKHLSQKKKN